MAWSTCDLSDRFEDRARVPEVLWRDFGARTAFTGAAVTVKCFEDNSRLKALSAEPGAGRVIVVDGGGSLRCAKNGWAGVVIWGAVRDVAALGGVDLGVKALGATPRRSVRRGEGQVDLPITFGGVTWRPGDVIFADPDGVLALSAEDASGVG